LVFFIVLVIVVLLLIIIIHPNTSAISLLKFLTNGIKA